MSRFNALLLLLCSRVALTHARVSPSPPIARDESNYGSLPGNSSNTDFISITLQQSGLAIVQGQRPTRASAIISLVNVTALGFSFGKVPTPFSLLLMLFVMVDLFIFYEFIRSKKRPVHMDAGATHLISEPPLRWFVRDDQGNWRPVDWRQRNEQLRTALRQEIYPDSNRYVLIRTMMFNFYFVIRFDS